MNNRAEIVLYYLLFMIILILLLNDNSNKIIDIKNVVEYNNIHTPTVRPNYKDTIMAYIPLHEGIRYNPYSCSAGHMTVGCGHVIKKTDNFTFPITQSQVDSLILNDVNKAEYYYNYYMPNSIVLKDNQKWAIVHLIFCKGIGNFNSSTLKQLIINKQPINKEILKWCHYHTPKGELVRSEWSYQIRLWELNLYNK